MLRAVVAFVIVAACGSKHPSMPSADASGEPIDADAAIEPDAPPPTASADPVPGLVGLAPACSGAGWCWAWPRPSGTDYSLISASAPNNLWIAGGGPPGYAAVLQWDGQMWHEHKPPLGTCAPGVACEYALPMAISTRAPNDTWLVYTNLTEHWDGTSWTIVDVEPTNVAVQGVWVAPDGDAWVTRSNGIVKRWHNGVPTIYNLNVGVGSIWGTSNEDVFATTIGAIFHFDGTQWSIVWSGNRTAGSYQGEKGNVWIAGAKGLLLHWNGNVVTEWPVPSLPTNGRLVAAWYRLRSDVTWIATGASAGAEYFVHFDGTALTTTPIDPALTSLGDNVCGLLNAAAVVDDRYWILCGGGAIATRSGPSTIASVLSPLGGYGVLWAATPSDLYHATGTTLRHWNGTQWTSTPMRLDGLSGLAGTGAGGANELFGVKETFIAGQYTWSFEHFDGATWSAYPLHTHAGYQKFITTVYPLGPREALLVGGLGTAYHFHEGVITPIATGTTRDLYSVWGPSKNELWIAGDGGLLLRWSRTSPTVFTPDSAFPETSDDLRTISAAGGITWISVANDTHVWMKPATGGWQQIASHVAPNAMVALAADDVVIAATDSGIVSRWNGTAFAIEYYPAWRGLNRLFALPDGTTYLSGASGIVMHP